MPSVSTYPALGPPGIFFFGRDVQKPGARKGGWSLQSGPQPEPLGARRHRPLPAAGVGNVRGSLGFGVGGGGRMARGGWKDGEGGGRQSPLLAELIAGMDGEGGGQTPPLALLIRRAVSGVLHLKVERGEYHRNRKQC